MTCGGGRAEKGGVYRSTSRSVTLTQAYHDPLTEDGRLRARIIVLRNLNRVRNVRGVERTVVLKDDLKGGAAALRNASSNTRKVCAKAPPLEICRVGERLVRYGIA